MKFLVIVLFAVVAVANAGYDAKYIFVSGQPPVPPLHAAPLAIHGNDKVTKIHYSAPHVGHPHLVGVEHYNPAPQYEPSVTNVALHGKY